MNHRTAFTQTTVGADAGVAAPPALPEPWGYWATLGWTLLAFILSALAALMCYSFWLGSTSPRSIPASHDGIVVAIGAFASIPVQIAVLAFAVRLKRWPLAAYFGFAGARRRDVMLALMLLIVVGGVIEGFLYVMGQELVPPFQVDAYRSAKAAGWLPELFLAIVLLAPVGEEIVFRGFLYRGFVRRPGQEPYVIVAVTLVWMMLHIQYDWVGLLQIFIIGLLLGWVRWISGSTILTIVMHMLMNLHATIETMIKVEWLSP